MDLPKDFDSRHCWILVAVAGALILIPSADADLVPGVLVGSALLLLGVGRWIDHKTTGHPWRPSAIGTLLCIAGVGLFGVGIYRLVSP